MEERLNWLDYFVLDITCPSGLRWNTNIYDSTGRLTKARVGRPAGSLSGQGRWQVQLHQKVYRCHRIIYELFYGPVKETEFIDHIDGDCSNNCISNLRLVPRSLNNRNVKK